MKIGFKYCGGCNPRYDRKAVYEEILDRADGIHEIAIADENGTYDYLIVLAGCTNACADCSGLSFQNEKIVITEYRQVCDTINRITKS
ncbi:hypothetical protein [Dethiosulfatibacter aminovorans]|uniref:hypothetical protein n=1 Tax=Dethiosulfatibacter aminovorans TaxID=332095 RepID=UPI0009334E57|nr:hypothetical protein [Dethiosulfatibacter aminovorans]